MNVDFHVSARRKLYEMLQSGSLLVIFSGEEIRKTNDEYYPFFADRNFVYLTGLECKQAILLAIKDSENTVFERLYLLPPDAHAERWTGKRIRPQEAESISGIKDVRYINSFEMDLHTFATSGNFGMLYLDLYRCSPKDLDRPVHHLLKNIQCEYPYLQIGNANESSYH